MDKLPLKLLGDNPVIHLGQDRLGFCRFVESRAHVMDPDLDLQVLNDRAEGLFDQAGNVWEWCATRWQEKYPLLEVLAP